MSSCLQSNLEAGMTAGPLTHQETEAQRVSNCAQCRVRELDPSDSRAPRGLRTTVEEALTLKPWALKRTEVSRPLRGSALRAGWSKAASAPCRRPSGCLRSFARLQADLVLLCFTDSAFFTNGTGQASLLASVLQQRLLIFCLCATFW